jgi:1,6-anhydro-N-acetylmuramate kinase
VDELGIDPQFMEAMAFAYFGLRTLRGQGVGGPWTGNLNPKHGGRITPGENWIPLLAKLSLST